MLYHSVSRMPNAATRPVHVLIVEDLPAHAFLLQEALRQASARVTTHVTGTAEEAVAYLASEARPQIDLIMLDLILPGQDGFVVLEALREKPEWQGTPVLVLSCSDKPEDMQRCYSMRANCFIAKPDRFSDLQATVASSAGFWLNHVVMPNLQLRRPGDLSWGQA